MWYKRGIYKRPYKAAMKRYSYKGKTNYGRIARDVKFLKSVINVEKKQVDTNISTAAAFPTNNTGTLVLLNGCQQGDTNTTRDGISVKGMYINIEGYVRLNGSSSDDVQIALLLDTQPNNTAATYGNVWDVSSAVAPVAPRNTNWATRFKVLKAIHLNLSSAGNQSRRFNIYCKISDHTRYTANSNVGTIADISTNAFYLAYAGSNTANFSTIIYSARYRFVDN